MPHISQANGPTNARGDEARVDVQEPIDAGVPPQGRPGEHGDFHAERNTTEGDEQGDYADFTKDDLVVELERRGLPKSGNKDELISRLTEDDAASADGE